jgi:signal transduction histidine kinase
MTACILWMEINRLKAPHDGAGPAQPGGVETSRGNRVLLWSLVTILNVAIISEVGVAYQALYQTEIERLHTLGMATGFSDAEVRQHVIERIQPIALGAVLTVLAIFTLAAILMAVIRQRDEQDQFMSMLSHELKTPLSVLRMALGSETMRATVKQHAIRSVEDINAVIDRCLQVDRLHHGRLSPHREPCQIDAILTEFHAISANPERWILEIANLPECKSDGQILRIILGNLIDNALKYGASDQELRIVASPATWRGNPGIAVAVTNTMGPAGFPDARRVFEKYYRAVGAHRKTGSGLGLYLSAHLARLIDGRLRYLPSDQAITFELWVPL